MDRRAGARRRGALRAIVQCGFGVVSSDDELDAALDETPRVLRMLERLGVRWICVTAGSPYYNPHMQRPALFPPSTATCRRRIRCAAWRGRSRRPRC